MGGPADAVRAFASSRTGVEALVERIGRRSVQVILVASDGEWTRVVVEDAGAGRRIAEDAGLTVHDAWTDDLRRRVRGFRRSSDDWAAAPYPEQHRHG